MCHAGPVGTSASHIAASSDQAPPPRQDPLLAASQSSEQLASGTPTPSQTDSLLPVSPRTPSSSSSPKKVELRNKAPHWNDTLRCWCLNFRGRVKLASVKNFQLMKAEDPSKTIVMQVNTFLALLLPCFFADSAAASLLLLSHMVLCRRLSMVCNAIVDSPRLIHFWLVFCSLGKWIPTPTLWITIQPKSVPCKLLPSV